MKKKFSKLLLSSLLVVLIFSSFFVCFATDTAVTTSETENKEIVQDANAETATEEEIHNGDLYLFDTNIVMDKLVDGNVFIFGTNVEITGQVNGNLFVFADSVNFNQSYIRYSIFACANTVNYNGACNDLYVATNKLDMTYDSYVVRDLKALSSTAILKAAVGRDVDLVSNTVDFGEDKDIAVIYGNLRYTANNEAEIPEGVITENGSVTYTIPKPSTLNESSNTETVSNLLISFLTCIVTVLVIFALIKKLAPNFAEKLSNTKISFIKLLKAFGIGLLSIVVVTILFILLTMSVIGMKLAFILLLIYVTLCLIASPILSIVIANILKPILKIEKTSMFYLIVILVSVVLHGLTLIPFVGGILGFIIKMIAIGLLLDMFLPHKELTDEEKVAVEEAKKQAKENKEKRKQEKLEAKSQKKQSKETKKENKE